MSKEKMPSLAVSDDEQDSEQSGEVKAAVKASGKLKYLFIVVLAIVISLGNVLMKWSFWVIVHHNTTQSCSLSQELLNLPFHMYLLLNNGKTFKNMSIRLSRRLMLTFGVAFHFTIFTVCSPSDVYTIMNNMTYIFLQYETPAELQLLWNFKIVATTFLLSCWLRRTFRVQQWTAVMVLTTGVIFAEMSHYNSNVSSDDSYPKVKGKHPVLNNVMFGPMLTVLGASVMSFANVFCESLYKENEETETLWMKNVRLYTFGALFNLAGFLANDHWVKSHHENPLYGFNIFTYIIVLSGSCSGLIIGFLLKYIDNIAVIHADAIGTIAATILSVIFFKLVVDWWFAVGIIFIISAIYLYHWNGDVFQVCRTEPL